MYAFKFLVMIILMYILWFKDGLTKTSGIQKIIKTSKQLEKL